MSPFLFSNLPVIHHETGYFLFSRIYMLASCSVIITYMVAGYRRKIPLNQLLLGAATFFLFFTLGNRLLAFTSVEWSQILSHGELPGKGNKSLLGGLTGLLAGIVLYALWTRNSKKIFDVVAVVLPVGMSIQRIACLLSGCCSGIPTRLPWGIRYDQHSDAWNSQVFSGEITPADTCSLPVHPIQVYDIIAWVIIFFICARAVRYFRASGSRLLLTILLYGFFRFFLEFLRDPFYDLIPGSFWGIKYIQWLILAGLPVPAILIIIRERRAGKLSHTGSPEEDIFARHFILTLIVVSLFLVSLRLFNMQEMIAMGLLLVSLFIITAIQVFRSTTGRLLSQNTLLLSGLIILLLVVSCARSRFATTTRHYHNGKVVYTNHYSNERVTLKRQKTKSTAIPKRDASAIITGKPADDPGTINKMDLIASSDKNGLILKNTEKQVSQHMYSPSSEFRNEKELMQSKHSRTTLIKDLASVAFKEIFPGDTTIAGKKDISKENAAGTEKTDNLKTEPLGLAGFILSFLGIIPVIGIPFAVLAFVFGIISLSRIKKYPKKYKGKGLATASIAIGCAMIVINIIIIASSIGAANDSASSCHPTTPNTSCRI